MPRLKLRSPWWSPSVSAAVPSRSLGPQRPGTPGGTSSNWVPLWAKTPPQGSRSPRTKSPVPEKASPKTGTPAVQGEKSLGTRSPPLWAKASGKAAPSAGPEYPSPELITPRKDSWKAYARNALRSPTKTPSDKAASPPPAFAPVTPRPVDPVKKVFHRLLSHATSLTKKRTPPKRQSPRETRDSSAAFRVFSRIGFGGWDPAGEPPPQAGVNARPAPAHSPRAEEKPSQTDEHADGSWSAVPADASMGVQSQSRAKQARMPLASDGSEPQDASGRGLEEPGAVSGLCNAFVEEGLRRGAPQDLAGQGFGHVSTVGMVHTLCRYPSDAVRQQPTGVCERAGKQSADETGSPEDAGPEPEQAWPPLGNVYGRPAIGDAQKGVAEVKTPQRAWPLEVGVRGCGSTTRLLEEGDSGNRLLESRETVFQTVVSHCISPTVSSLSQDTEANSAFECSGAAVGAADSMFRTGASHCLSPDVCSLSDQNPAWDAGECDEVSQPLNTVFQTVVSHCLSPAASSLSDWASDVCGHPEGPLVMPSDSTLVAANPHSAGDAATAPPTMAGVHPGTVKSSFANRKDVTLELEPSGWTGNGCDAPGRAACGKGGAQLVPAPCGAKPAAAGPSVGTSFAAAPGSPCLAAQRAAVKGSPALDAGKRVTYKPPAGEGSICTSMVGGSSGQQPLPQSQWNAYLFSTAETMSSVEGDEADFQDMWDAAADAQMSFLSALNH